MISIILAGIGLAAGAGLNAYLPLLVLALTDRYTDAINLPTPFDILSSLWGIVVLLLILPLELFPDKIARVDHFSDLVHTAIRPGAGAFAFMAVASTHDDFQIVMGFILGLVIAGAIHWIKASSRPRITRTTNGIGNPLVSLLEDALCVVFAVVAVFMPLGTFAVVPLGLLLLVRTYRRLQSGDTRMMAVFNPTSAANRRS